jgi:ATP-dependent Clp protease, protease subunit
MYGYIGEYEAIDDAAFVMDLQNLASKYPEILIRVNCGGGDVYKGMTIYNSIKENRDKVKIKIDGIAASMGAIFPLAAKKENVTISRYGRMMTHRVSGIAIGNADDLRNSATEFEAWENTISTILSERTGLSNEEAKKKYIVNQDRWISGQQATDEGLVGGVYDAEPVNAPEDSIIENVFNSYNVILNKATTSQQKKYTMKKDLLKKLSLADDATDEQIDAAVEKALNDKDTAESAAKTEVMNKAKLLIDGAIKNKQLTEADRVEYEAMAVSNYDFTAKVIAKVQPVKSITSQLIQKKEKKEGEAVTEEGSDYEALVAQGTAVFASYKSEHPAEYRKIWEAHFKAPFPEQNA